MAKIDMHTNNISGKVGDNVYYLRNGKQLMRRKPAPRKTEPSIPELKHRSKFAFITKFLLPLNSLFYETFRSDNMLPFNKALSVNYNHVIPESYPDWRVDFSKFRLGEGDIPGLANLTVNNLEAGQLQFNWNEKLHPRLSTRLDRIYIAIYNEDLNMWLTYLGSVYRKDGSFILDAEPFSGFPVHIYLGLISDFWGESSDSQYLGMVIINNIS